MGIFDRFVEVVRSNMTPLDEPDPLDLDALLGAPTDETFPLDEAAEADIAAPELVARWYGVLELPAGAELQAVRSSYRRLLFRFHPDKFAGDPDKQRMATELTRGLTVAYRGLAAHLRASSRG
jgi:DnaJ-domain-containing protein 1